MAAFKKKAGRSIHRMPFPRDVGFFMRPKDLLYGMDGRAWIWHEALTWQIGHEPKAAVIKIKRKSKRKWVVTIPDDVSINAGDAEPETWVPVEIEEPRTPRNLNPFVAFVKGMGGMGGALQDVNEAFEGAARAIASGGRALATAEGRRRKKKAKVPVEITPMAEEIAAIVEGPETLNLHDLIANKFEPKGA